MTPLAVDPGALDRAGADMMSAGESLGWVVSTLTMTLSGCPEMAGDDPAGARLGRSYDRLASQLLEAEAKDPSGPDRGALDGELNGLIGMLAVMWSVMRQLTGDTADRQLAERPDRPG